MANASCRSKTLPKSCEPMANCPMLTPPPFCGHCVLIIAIPTSLPHPQLTLSNVAYTPTMYGKLMRPCVYYSTCQKAAWRSWKKKNFIKTNRKTSNGLRTTELFVMPLPTTTAGRFTANTSQGRSQAKTLPKSLSMAFKSEQVMTHCMAYLLT